MNIFELLHEKYVLPKKPKLFESFSGIGCQRMAFKRLGIEVEMVGISEIDKYAIQSYMAIHGETKNWGSITDIKGSDLPEIDVFSWSFPCTDLSKAGKQKGLNGTRSGLVYEVLRIMHECKEHGNLPKVLIMENVVDLVQSKFIREFQEIQFELEQLGYSNYAETLNAKDYGVAQNRDRAFMVSILGDKYYEFPKPIKLEKRLEDYLETNVDEKYYLSKTIIDYYLINTKKNSDKGNGFKFQPKDGSGIAGTILTKEGSRMDDNYIFSENKVCDFRYDEGFRSREEDDISPTLPATHLGTSSMSGQPFVDNGLRIRKLTPRECWRLMGIDDEDFDKASQVCSNSQLYKQAGNGIVVDVFAAILSTMKGE